MSYLTVEVDISGGKIVAREPDKLPQQGMGLLTILAKGPEERTNQRPIGLARGEFSVPKDFNEPLPDEVLKEFEGE